MGWMDVLAHSRGLTELVQYPDVNLYNSAAAMRPEDRPSVPVRLTDNPQEQFPKYKTYKDANLPEAFVLPDRQSIFINKNKPAYKDKRRLAALMGHEQRHVLGEDEQQSRVREADILMGLGDSKYAGAIRKQYGIK